MWARSAGHNFGSRLQSGGLALGLGPCLTGSVSVSIFVSRIWSRSRFRSRKSVFNVTAANRCLPHRIILNVTGQGAAHGTADWPGGRTCNRAASESASWAARRRSTSCRCRRDSTAMPTSARTSTAAPTYFRRSTDLLTASPDLLPVTDLLPLSGGSVAEVSSRTPGVALTRSVSVRTGVERPATSHHRSTFT